MSEEQIQAEATIGQTARLLGLFMPSILLSGFMAQGSDHSFSITGAVVIVLAGVASILPFKGSSAAMLQKLVCLYLAFVLVERASTQYVAVPFQGYSVKLSYGIAILALCLAGAVVGRFMKMSTRSNDSFLVGGWALAWGIMVVHMLALLGLLRWKYGYGYERDAAVLGNVSLGLVLYVLLWRPLTYRSIRIGVALVFIAYAASVVK